MPELSKNILLISPPPVLYYNMEGNSTDIMGVYNGTDSNMSYGVTYGKFGQGAHFNGSSGKITTPLSISNKSFSISLWIKKTTAGTTAEIASAGTGTSQGEWLHLYYRAATAISVSFYSDDSGDAAIPDDTNWHHVVLTFNSSTRARKIYIDGVLRMSDTSTGLCHPNTNVVIGNLVYNNTAWFPGDMDDIAIFLRELSGDEVSTIFSTTNYLKQYRRVRIPGSVNGI